MSMPRRVRILSASSGAGHVRAAQALEKVLAARGDARAESTDALDYTSKLFQKICGDAYITLVRRAPSLMGLLYDRFDQPWRHRRRRLALDRGLPMALIEPIPGQEERSATRIICWSKSQPSVLNNLPVAARKVARPRAAAEIVADALGLLEMS